MGRGPSLTISFTYPMARAESIVGGGALSGGSESLGRGSSAAAAGGWVWAFTGPVSLSRSQPSKTTTESKSSAMAIILLIMFLPIVFLLTRNEPQRVRRRPKESYAAFFSFRARRCLGWTAQAIPMLTTYNAIIGAAKMHIFKTSGVGVTIAAMKKMSRI